MSPLSYREILERDGYFVGPPVGTSMNPLLKMGRDVMVIRTCERPRLLDVILFRRKSGEYILHRLVGRDRQGYVFRGDHQLVNEHGIGEDQIVGRMTAFCRHGKTISCDTLWVRAYSLGIWLGYPLRVIYCVGRRLCGYLLRRVKRMIHL